MKTKPGFNIKTVCGQDLLVAEGEENIDFSSIISMNETSSYLWNALQKLDDFTVSDMVALLTNVYDVDDDTARKDCEDLVSQWKQIGVVTDD